VSFVQSINILLQQLKKYFKIKIPTVHNVNIVYKYMWIYTEILSHIAYYYKTVLY